jgi:hypothetical protein
MRVQMVWTVGLGLLLACGPDVAGSSASGEGGGSEGSGSASETLSSGADESSTGPGPDACPEVVQDADCASQGDVCSQGDFECTCVCFCDSPSPGAPGGWECAYAWADSVLTLADAQITIDCDAPAISAELSLVIENAGSSAIAVVLERNFGFFLSIDGMEEQPCGGLCLDCGQTDPVTVEPGATSNASLAIAPTMCGQEATNAILCSFCGGTAQTTITWSLETEGKNAWDGATFEDLPIVCE